MPSKTSLTLGNRYKGQDMLLFVLYTGYALLQSPSSACRLDLQSSDVWTRLNDIYTKQVCGLSRCRSRCACETTVQDLVAAAFLPLALVGATFFVGAVFVDLAAGFFAGLAFFLGVLFFDLLAAADLLTFALVVFLAGDLVAFLTPKTSSQMLSINVRKQARQADTSRAKGSIGLQ